MLSSDNGFSLKLRQEWQHTSILSRKIQLQTSPWKSWIRTKAITVAYGMIISWLIMWAAVRDKWFRYLQFSFNATATRHSVVVKGTADTTAAISTGVAASVNPHATHECMVYILRCVLRISQCCSFTRHVNMYWLLGQTIINNYKIIPGLPSQMMLLNNRTNRSCKHSFILKTMGNWLQSSRKIAIDRFIIYIFSQIWFIGTSINRLEFKCRQVHKNCHKNIGNNMYDYLKQINVKKELRK